MAVPLIGSANALFPRLGRVGKAAIQLSTAQTGIAATITDVLGRYAAGPEESLTGQLAIGRDGAIRAVSASPINYLRTLGINTLAYMVKADVPARSADPVAELVRQMKLSVDSVPRCTVGSTLTPDGTNIGDGVALVTLVRGDGLTQELTVPESARISITADARTGGATAGLERATFSGVPNIAGVWDYDYPQGSGASVQFVAVSPAANFLANSGFDNWTALLLNNWTITNTTKETTLIYGATGNAARVAAGATGTLLQAFAISTGTTQALAPLTSLAFNFRIRGSVAMTGGTIAVALVDGSGTTLIDDTGASQSISFNLNGIGTTYVARNGVLRTPRILPSSVQLKITITNPVTGDAIIDGMAATRLTAAYPGGPGLALFSGATAFANGDGWGLVTTNNYAGAGYNLTWQSLFARIFGQGGSVLLPSSNAPTVLDNLITA